MAPQLSIVVVNYGTPRLLLSLLGSVGRSPDLALVREVIIVDNGYPQQGDSRTVVDSASHPFPIVFTRNRQHSYASGVNCGAALASGDFLVISNTDIELLPDASLRPLVSALSDEGLRIGVAGPQLVYPDGSWQQSARRFPCIHEAVLKLLMVDTAWHGLLTHRVGQRGWPDRTRQVDYVDAAFIAVHPECFWTIGGFDPSYLFYGEDADFCWRAARAGWKTVLVPLTRVMHVRGASSEGDRLRQATVRLLHAKQRFVRERQGPLRAAWYGRLYRIAVWERALFYGLVARLVPREHWKERASTARARWQAIADGPGEPGSGWNTV